MGLKVGEPFGFDARFDVADACFKLEAILDEVHHLDEIPFGGVTWCVYEWGVSSLGFDDNVLPEPLDHSHMSPMCSQPSISPEYSLDTPIDNLKIYDSNVDLGSVDNMFNMLGGNVDNFLSLWYVFGYDTSLYSYCMYIVDKPGKIM